MTIYYTQHNFLTSLKGFACFYNSSFIYIISSLTEEDCSRLQLCAEEQKKEIAQTRQENGMFQYLANIGIYEACA